MIGSVVSHFRIVEKLGEGGMGEVYRAEDMRLGRTVALKFLPLQAFAGDARRERFLREAKAASGLAHPAICTIHDIEESDGRLFIVMECIEGDTLRDLSGRRTLSTDEVLLLGAQVADGLSAAHGAGIVHRDIKPENLMMGRDGRARILDFGLALWRGASPLSMPGTIVGTAAYMPPEQILGGAVDGRADIYALCAVLYELISGRPPFVADHHAALLYQITNSDPPPLLQLKPGLDPGAAETIMRGLSRDPDGRPATAAELAAALRGAASVSAGGSHSASATDRRGTAPRPRRLTPVRISTIAAGLLAVGLGAWRAAAWLGARPDDEVHSLAILPLVNESADTSLEYLSDGITESVIDDLARLPAVKVMSRASVFRYRGRNVDPQSAGRDLGVGAVLVGRVAPREGFVTVSVELLRIGDNSQIWGEQFRRREGEVFDLQDDVAGEIVRNLRPHLAEGELARLGGAHTRDAETYTLYLKGMYHWNKRTPDDLEESIRLFRAAIDRDPGDAEAYTGLASAYDVMVSWGAIDPVTGMREAESAARRALALDPGSGEAHAALAGVLEFRYDRLGALAEYRRAIELSPSDAIAFQWYAEDLAELRRFDEAIDMFRRAQELDPLSLVIPAVGAVFYANSGRLDDALALAHKALDLDAHAPMGHLAVGLAFTRAGRYAEAVPELEKGTDLSDSETTMVSWLGTAYALAGRRRDAERILDRLENLSSVRYISPYMRALVNTGLGRNDRALALLEEGVRRHDGWMGQTYEEKMFDPLRGDPRYTDVVRRLGLTPGSSAGPPVKLK